MPEVYQSLPHSRSDCNYQVIFVPERRRKVLYRQSAATRDRNSMH